MGVHIQPFIRQINIATCPLYYPRYDRVQRLGGILYVLSNHEKVG